MCDYQTNGARVRATGIVVILTHPLNREDNFLSDNFCLTSLLPLVNCACAHKTVGRHDGELLQNVL